MFETYSDSIFRGRHDLQLVRHNHTQSHTQTHTHTHTHTQPHGYPRSATADEHWEGVQRLFAREKRASFGQSYWDRNSSSQVRSQLTARVVARFDPNSNKAALTRRS